MSAMAEARGSSGRPRIVFGDLNDIKSNQEKQGGSTRSENSFATFRHMLSTNGLHDVKMVGGKYTWVGQRHFYSVKTKIDRAIVNCEWLDIFPNSWIF